MDGQPLSNIMERNAPLGLDRVVVIITQIACELERIESTGRAYAHLTPDDVMLHAGDRIVLRDEGNYEQNGDVDKSDASLQVAAYRSPEQHRGEPPTIASDVFSLGVLTYQLLSGQLPTHEPASQDITRAGSHQTLPFDISLAVEAALWQALRPDPRDRWRSPTAFATALARAASVPIELQRRRPVPTVSSAAKLNASRTDESSPLGEVPAWKSSDAPTVDSSIDMAQAQRSTRVPSMPADSEALWTFPLRGALTIYRRQARSWLVVAAPLLQLGPASWVLAQFGESPVFLGWFSTAVRVLVTGALLSGCKSTLTSGSFKPSEAYDNVLRRFWPLLVAYILRTVLASVVAVAAIIVSALPLWLAIAFLGEEALAYRIWIAGSIFICAAIYMIVRLWFALPSVILAEQGALQSIKSSWTATRGNVRQLLGYMLLLWALHWLWPVLEEVVAGFPTLSLIRANGDLATAALQQPPLLSMVAGSIFEWLIVPFPTIVLALLWFKTRNPRA